MGILTGGERKRVREMFARGNLIYLRGMSVEKILFIAKQWRQGLEWITGNLLTCDGSSVAEHTSS